MSGLDGGLSESELWQHRTWQNYNLATLCIYWRKFCQRPLFALLQIFCLVTDRIVRNFRLHTEEWYKCLRPFLNETGSLRGSRVQCDIINIEFINSDSII
jgi:hypothetical protein